MEKFQQYKRKKKITYPDTYEWVAKYYFDSYPFPTVLTLNMGYSLATHQSTVVVHMTPLI